MRVARNTLFVTGRLDTGRTAELDAALEKLCHLNFPEVVIDLVEVEFVSSPCLASFVLAKVKCQERGRKFALHVNEPLYDFLVSAQMSEHLNPIVIPPEGESDDAP